MLAEHDLFPVQALPQETPLSSLALPKFCLSAPTSRLDPRHDLRFVRWPVSLFLMPDAAGGNKAAMLKEVQRPDIQELAAGVGTLTFEFPQWAFSVSALLPQRCPFTFVAQITPFSCGGTLRFFLFCFRSVCISESTQARKGCDGANG